MIRLHSAKAPLPDWSGLIPGGEALLAKCLVWARCNARTRMAEEERIALPLCACLSLARLIAFLSPTEPVLELPVCSALSALAEYGGDLLCWRKPIILAACSPFCPAERGQ